MEALGQGKKYQGIILTEISQVGGNQGSREAGMGRVCKSDVRRHPRPGVPRASGVEPQLSLMVLKFLTLIPTSPAALCRNYRKWKTLTAEGVRILRRLLPPVNQRWQGAHP